MPRKSAKKAHTKNAAKKKTVGGKQAMVVTLSGDRPIHEVAKDLMAAGFEVGQVLETIGSITGSAHPYDKKHLDSIKGVADVRLDQGVDIGPPDAPIS